MTKTIEDGYNLSRTLPKLPFVEGRVEITFRPAAGASHRAFSRALMGGVAEATAMGAGIIAGCVTAWNLRRGEKGYSGGLMGSGTANATGEVAVTAEEAAKLPAGLFTEILDAVFGFGSTEESADAAKN